MQHSGVIRKAGRIGASLAFASSILVLAGPAASAQVATMGYHGHDGHAQFLVTLSGDEERDGGDRDGRGTAGLDFDADHERVCYYVKWDRLEGAVTAFHLHHAPRHEDGGHWIDFFNDRRLDGDHNAVFDCVHASRDKIYEVLDHPDEFYLNLHSTAHDMGAIRGQLD